MRRKVILCGAILFAAIGMHRDARCQPSVLDQFESLEGWRAITSEGALLNLRSAPGKTGNAMVMDFDLSKVAGYVIAQKDFSLELPQNYQFMFDLRADAPVNNFEFKLLDERGNVFWIKQLNINYPRTWTTTRIKKRQLSYAWGPERRDQIHSVRKIEFVVSVGSGGKGQVFIDNFRLVPIDDAAAAAAHMETAGPTGGAVIDEQQNSVLHWSSPPDSLMLDFHHQREVGGLILDWDSAAFAGSYSVEFSDDGREWSTGYRAHNGNGGRDYLYMQGAEGRYMKLRSTSSHSVRLKRLQVQGPAFSNSPNDFFQKLAIDAPRGFYPKHMLRKQSYWTVLGVDADDKEALLNEQGDIEVDKGQFMLEPFLFVDGKLITWNEVTTTPGLLEDELPLPSVLWDYHGEWQLQVEGCAAGVPGNSLLGVRYSLTCTGSAPKDVKVFIAVRPFQVNPSWQFLNLQGGTARIDSIIYDDAMVQVNGRDVVPVTPPTGFGAAEFDQGDITEYMSKGVLPPTKVVRDHFGYASGALMYDFSRLEDKTAEIIIAVPFHGWKGSPSANMGGGGGSAYYRLMTKQTAAQWRAKLHTFELTLPHAAAEVARTLRTTIADILINRDGPGIQPGSRSYERSWIRDGALTCSALLRTGHWQEVRDFIDWYARGQFPSGKIPCVIDAHGADAVPENDSHGEFIYAVLQYFLFSHDTLWLKGKWDVVTKTVSYIQSLRAERKTEKYVNGTAEEQACYGLVPESISHEGYSDVPRHSYWDDFFVLRGLKDATTIAAVLGEKQKEAAYAAERDDFRKDFYVSMRRAMKNKNIDYIPGCVELGDFDATSTTIGVVPGGELGRIPEPQLHNTFDRYYKFFVSREKTESVNYTPYETRVIGTFVRLGQKDRAEEALKFFMHDRRPAAWNQWAEVVWTPPDTACYVGDMPHTWVGSDFMRSVLCMFVYDREEDSAHVLAAGIPDTWIKDSAGVSIRDLQTYHGTVSYDLRAHGRSVHATVSGTFDATRHTLVLASPMQGKLLQVRVGGKTVRVPASREIVIRKLPAEVDFTYKAP